jgi:primase-polymerase (primpol)-like protein
VKPKDLEQWVCWRREERAGKPTKVPYSPRSGSRARSDDPETWGTFAEAREARRDANYDGVGFVFAADDPFCGVDLDGCVDPETGEIESWAAEVLAKLDSYAEISPSGTGLHVIVRATLPEGRRRNGRVEMYDRGRFFTVTGNHLPGTRRSVEDRQEQIDALHAHLFPREALAKNDSAPSDGPTDAEVLRRAMSAANGARFAALWAGDRSGYASDSEADLALCSMLAFWVGSDEARIASLFARSGLMREKWNREDYRRRTVSRALAGATQFYSPGKNDTDV